MKNSEPHTVVCVGLRLTGSKPLPAVRTQNILTTKLFAIPTAQLRISHNIIASTLRPK